MHIAPMQARATRGKGDKYLFRGSRMVTPFRKNSLAGIESGKINLEQIRSLESLLRDLVSAPTLEIDFDVGASQFVDHATRFQVRYLNRSFPRITKLQLLGLLVFSH